MAIPGSFLSPIISGAAEYLQILDPVSRDPVTDDVQLRIAAITALGQIVGAIHRPVLKDTYTERYRKVCGEITLRVTPVLSVTEVKAVDSVLVVGTDYNVIGNRIEFETFGFDQFFIGANDLQDITVDVTYIGGLNRLSAEDTLLQALILQTSANYRRTSTVGLTSITGGQGGGSLSQSSDRGGIIESVQGIINPLEYFGDALER